MANRILSFLFLLAVAPVPARAEPVNVRHPQGTVHGFLTIHSESGALLGYGESTEVANGDRITMRTTLHFRDGSLDDETAVFTQRNVFRFVSDHHIQRGPFFKTSIDSAVDAEGQVTIHTTGSDGKVKDESSHIDLPEDLSNGFAGTLIENLPHEAAGLTVGMVVPVGKGRLIKLNITRDRTASFSAVTGYRRTATVFRIKPELGGVVGVIAPIIGKQPRDTLLWVIEGDAPVIVREDTQLSEGGPIVSVQLAGTSFPKSAPGK